MDERPERVGSMGLNNAEPTLGRGQIFKAGALQKKRVSAAATARANRVRAQKERVARAKAAEKQLNKNENSSSVSRDMSLGLFVFSSELPSIEQIGSIITNLTAKPNKLKKNTTIGSLKYTLVELKARNARFREVYSITEEYKLSYNRRQEIKESTTYDFKIKITQGDVTKTGVISFFPNSQKILIKGGYFDCNNSTGYSGLTSQPRNLLAALFQMYGRSLRKFPSLERQNTVATLRLGKKFDEKQFKIDTFGKTKFANLNFVKSVKDKSVPRTVMVNAKYPNYKIFITSQGVVQVSFKGKVTKDELELYRKKILKFDTLFRKYLKGKAASPPTFVSRSGKRLNNNPAPNVSRRGTSCPPERRPTPYSFSGKCPKGSYIKPNPHQQPCCYTIPKKNTATTARETQAAYNSAGIAIPQSVKNVFGIGNLRNSNNLGNNITNSIPKTKIYATRAVVLQKNGQYKTVNTIRIGTRQCLRLPKQKLVDIVMRMGYANKGIGSKSKPELCELIKSLAKNTDINDTQNRYIPSFKLQGKNTQLTLKNNRKLVIGRRECSSIPRPKLQKICGALGIRITEDTTARAMCEFIGDKREKMLAALTNKKEANKEAAIAKRAKMTNNENSRQQKVLYQMFITSIEPWSRKYEKYGARTTLPTQTEFMNNFNRNVQNSQVEPVKDTRKRGWKKPFAIWLKKYVNSHKASYVNNLNNRKKQEKNMKKEASAKPKPLTFSIEDARDDLILFRNSVINKRLHPLFNNRLNNFTKNYRKEVLAMNSGNLNSRRKGWFNYQTGMGGNMMNYFQKEVSKLEPKKLGNNKIQRWVLDRNYQLYLGPVRELL